MSRNIETVNTYLDGFRRNNHEQILSCLTDDIEWTVFGAFHLKGKAAYDKAIALEPNNQLIKQNYDLFKELNDRAAQKDGRQP